MAINGENYSTGGAIVTLFPKFWDKLIFVFSDEIAQKFICIIYIIRNNNGTIWVQITH